MTDFFGFKANRIFFKTTITMIEVGSDFSGVGAFDQALRKLKIDYRTVFACDMDLYARETYMANYGEPYYYPFDVYDRKIPKKPLDIYMTSPPCQGFSMAGKREGSVLFYNSHEFIIKNKPRYFIFENVKGLLSHEKGRTFQIWLDMLGGKSVNGNPVIFPREDAAPYHIYHQVLNAKHFGVPQNRERVFIIGIRDDADNNFHFPKPFHLVKRLKDVLEKEVDKKFYLSDKMIEGFIKSSARHEEKGTGFQWHPKTENEIANCLRANAALCKTDNTLKVGYINQNTQASQVFSENGSSPNICAGTHGYANGYVKVKSATKKGYEIATENDSINLSNFSSKTRRGRVGKEVPQTLDTSCAQGILIKKQNYEESTIKEENTFEKLRTMWSEAREKAFKKWKIGSLTTLQQKTILQQRLQAQEYDKNWFKQSISKTSTQHSEKYTKAFYKEELLREMWKEWETRYTSLRREFPKQQLGKLDDIMSELSQKNPLKPKTNLQDGELQKQIESIRVLQQALSKIEVLWESDVCKPTNKERRESNISKRLDNQAVIINPLKDKTDKGWHFEQGVYDENGITRALKSSEGSGNKPKVVVENWIKGGMQQNQPKQINGISPCMTSSMRDGEWKANRGTRNPPIVGNQEVFLNENQLLKFNSLKVDENISGCITNAIGRAGSSDEYMASIKRNAIITNTIRRLTPRECFRLMDFPDTFKMPCSNTQMYKQAGNSIVVNVLAEIIKKLKL